MRPIVGLAVVALATVGFGIASRADAAGPTAKLTVRVWSDTNGNGRYDAGEPNASGRTVKFASPTYTTTRTTGTSGWVGAFVPAGCYQVTLGGSELTTAYAINVNAAVPGELRYPLPGTLSGMNMAKPGIRGFSACVSDGTVKEAYIGLRPSGTHNLAVKVWNDLNLNGRQDAGEPGIPNFALTISDIVEDGYDVSRTFPTKSTTSTGWAGWALPRGTCGLVIVPGEFYNGRTGKVYNGPWSPTRSRRTDSTTQSDWMGPGAPFCVSDRDVTLEIGLVNVDATNLAGPVVSGTVWTDTNGDGQRQAGEPLVNGGVNIATGVRGKWASCRERSTAVVNGTYRLATSKGLRCVYSDDASPALSWDTIYPYPSLTRDWLFVFADSPTAGSKITPTTPNVGNDATDSDFALDQGCRWQDGGACVTYENPPAKITADLGIKAGTLR